MSHLELYSLYLKFLNDNAYKIDLSGGYSISPTFNMADLSLFYAGDDLVDLRANAF